MHISPTRFRRILAQFQNHHRIKSGKSLTSFADRSSYLLQEEIHKLIIPELARKKLEVNRWKRAQIGSGVILKRVISAIEIAPNPLLPKGNNLVHWQAKSGPKSRVHLAIIEAVDDSAKCMELEGLFYQLYKDTRPSGELFDHLVHHIKAKYDLLAFLFFIVDPTVYLPIGTTTFDKAFQILGVDLTTTRRCSWENYQIFLDAIKAVQNALHAEGFPEATLLDAHSFCWVIAKQSDETIQPNSAKFSSFTGKVLPVQIRTVFTPNENAKVVDMNTVAANRQASGLVAEEIAIKAERDRLTALRHPDLAKKVEDVSHRPALGYDIFSYEPDGSPRHIEVKNITNGNRFYLSENEWQHSQHLPNYWFYLVDEKGPKIQTLKASNIPPTALQPTQYRINFKH